MKARETREGQRYILPSRFGQNVAGISYGWNHSQQWLLFLLEKGQERVMKTLMPEEEVIQPLE